MKILIFGATGVVGSQVFQQALADPNIDHIMAPTRHPLTTQAAKLSNPVVDFSQPLALDLQGYEAAICALGTTRKQAGSAQAFVDVDLHLVAALASYCHQAGVRRFIFNSSMGADKPKGLYLTTKYHAEKALQDMAFEHLTLVRPSLIDTYQRPDKRVGETLALAMTRPFSQLLPASIRPIRPEQIAWHMCQALAQTNAVRVIDNKQLQQAPENLPS